jgi:serine/threonine protein phosphatase 1
MEIVAEENLKEDPSKKLLFTVGNINGNFQLLIKMIEEIENCGIFCKGDKVVFLGNFIGGKGEDREIIDTLRDYELARPNQCVIIRGANEQRMLTSKKNFFESELGKGVLKSYRQSPPIYQTSVVNDLDIQQFVDDSIWLSTLPSWYKSNKYFFVHAGVNPKRDLEDQNVGGFMFINDEFYSSGKVFSHRIVHTHTGQKLVYAKNRFGIGREEAGTLRCFVMNDKKISDTEFGPSVEEVIRVKASA